MKITDVARINQTERQYFAIFQRHPKRRIDRRSNGFVSFPEKQLIQLARHQFRLKIAAQVSVLYAHNKILNSGLAGS